MSGKHLKTLDKFNLVIQTFTPEYGCLAESFNSGVFAFNNFISKEALTEKENGNGVTYIILDEKDNNERVLVGYYTISATTTHIKDSLDYQDSDVPLSEKRVHYYPISSFMINMFAVNKDYHCTLYKDTLVSDLILKSIIIKLYEMSINLIGAKQIVLCSVKDKVDFYKRNNFNVIDENQTLLDKYVDDTIPMALILHDENCS